MAVGNLELISTTTISTSVSSIEVDNIFSSTYDVYEIHIFGFSATTAGAVTMVLQYLDSGGTVIDQAEYDYAVLRLRASSSFLENRATGATSTQILGYFDSGARQNGLVFRVFNPNDSSSYTFSQWEAAGMISDNLNGNTKGIGVHKSAESVRGIKLKDTGGSLTFDEGQINVYGVK